MNTVVVAIVGYRSGKEIRACVESLKRSETHGISVHVCENGGVAAFRDVTAAFVADAAFVAAEVDRTRSASGPRIAETRRFRAVDEASAVREIVVHRAVSNLGYAGGVNEILGSIRHRPDWSAVWVLNPDTEPCSNALAQLIERAKAGGYGIVGARLIVKESGRVQLYGGRWRHWLGRGFNIGLDNPVDAPVDVEAIEKEQSYVSGAAMFVSRAFVESVGPMHEGYFLYAEEIDWCLRRGAFGLGYAHDAVVFHAHGALIGSNMNRRLKSPLSIFLEERARMLLTRRFYPWHFPVAMVAALLLTGHYAKARAPRNFAYALRGWWAGVRGETGIPRQMKPFLEPSPRSAS